MATGAMKTEASSADRRECCCSINNDVRETIFAAIGGLLIIALFALPLGYLVYLASTGPFKTVEYSVTINAVHGLDPKTVVMNPEFDLTLSVKAYQEIAGGWCYEPGTTVEVTYRGVLLASAPVDKFCADATGQTRERRFVAWGTEVRLPGFALDALVADARNGAEAFDVAVKMPSKQSGIYHFMGKLISCKARPVGEAAMWTPCDVYSMDIPVPPSRNAGKTQTGDVNRV